MTNFHLQNYKHYRSYYNAMLLFHILLAYNGYIHSYIFSFLQNF